VQFTLSHQTASSSPDALTAWNKVVSVVIQENVFG
jgi:hypothetical protein